MRTKKVEVKFDKVKDHMKARTINFVYIPSTSKASDVLTKFLSKYNHTANEFLLGMNIT